MGSSVENETSFGWENCWTPENVYLVVAQGLGEDEKVFLFKMGDEGVIESGKWVPGKK